MTNRQIWMGVLAIVLAFGLPAAGYGQSLDGTWFEVSFPNDPEVALKLNNGRIDSEYLRGTYTTRNNEITITPTHYIGWFLQVFGEFFVMSGARPLEWYSREQMGNLLRNHPLNAINKPSAQDINKMLDTMYPTETIPIIGGNKFSFSFINYTYIRGNTTSLQQNQTPKQDQTPNEDDFTVDDNGVITKYTGSNTAFVIPAKIGGKNITAIGEEAFKETGIISVTIPNGVTSIERRAFSGCTSLISVTIPASVTSIRGEVFLLQNGAFYGCTSLTSVTFQGAIPSGGFQSLKVTENGTLRRVCAFPGDLYDKFYATDKDKGTPGTYTRPDGRSQIWTKQ